MAPEILAILKSLTMRPSQSVAKNLEPVLFGLEHAGYVAKGPSGWIATSKGCALVEEQRSWSQEPPSPIERFQQ